MKVNARKARKKQGNVKVVVEELKKRNCLTFNIRFSN